MRCPQCNVLDTKIVYTNKRMPYGTTMPDITIDLEVSYCKSCSFVFQSSAYNDEYDKNIQTLYKNYAITDMYNFPNKNYYNTKAIDFISEIINDSIDYNVLEIGSNRGDFLYLLKEKFSKINILGCEPTEFKNLRVPTINSFFDVDLFNTKFDLIVIRHTLEHIKNPKEFVSKLKKVLSKDGKIFIEVPNIINSLDNMIEDFTPDHVNYFSTKTLEDTFSNYGVFKNNDKEFLYTIFTQTKDDKNKLIEHDMEHLFATYNTKLNKIKQKIKNYDRIIFYGISNFYLWTYSKLKDEISDKKLLLKDDNLSTDKLFGLEFVEEITEHDLVILCTSNKKLQKQMSQKLPKYVDILYPWSGINNV